MIICGTTDEVEKLESEVIKQTAELYDLAAKTNNKLATLESSWRDGNYAFFQEKIRRILQLLNERLKDVKGVQMNLHAYREFLEKYASGSVAKRTSDIVSPLASYQRGASLNLCNKIREIGEKMYLAAQKIASKSELGSLFTNHTEKHTEMVRQKSLEVCRALKEAFRMGYLEQILDEESDLPFCFDCNEEVLSLAALLHDVGMSGIGYMWNGKNIIPLDRNNCDFDDVRKNHSFNSGLYVLQQREALKKLGYSDEQIDAAAMACVVHSKSNGGVKNLNSSQDWNKCFDKMNQFVDQYNKEHPENRISFNSSAFVNDSKKLGNLAMLTFSLRVGDVSRDSCAGDIGQTGETIDVLLETINKGVNNYESEIRDAVITRGKNKIPVTMEMSRRIHVGEQNIRLNRTFFDKKGIVHEITVRDAELAPYSTWKAIEDHLGELRSAKALRFRVNIVFDQTGNDSKVMGRWETERRIASSDSNTSVLIKW